MKHPIVGFALLAASCASVPSAGVPVTGSWGGTHVGLVLDSSGGRLEYDCAAGTIGPVAPDSSGRFTAEGRHTAAAGGPEIEGQVRPSFPTRYSGSVRGDRMTLRGRLSNGVELGPFTLRRNAEPIIFRCL